MLSYMHALEIMQQYSQVLSAARDLLLRTRYLPSSVLQWGYHECSWQL